MVSTTPLAIPDPVEKANQAFLEERRLLVPDILFSGPVSTTTGGLETARALREITDTWLIQLWQHALPDAFSESASLHATGGYGRDELAVHSDLDVLIALHNPEIATEPKFELAMERLMVWVRHTRMRLSHAVRTADQARESLDEDLRTAISLLDLRHLHGPMPPTAFAGAKVLEHLRNNDEGRQFVESLFQGHRERVARYGQTVFLLEPDVKNGEGGLRDLNYLAWGARVRWQIDIRRQDAPDIGWTPEHREVYRQNLDALLGLRNRLHILRGRKHDRLTFREQEALVRLNELGREKRSQNEIEQTLAEIEAPLEEADRAALTPNIEHKMADYYRRGRRIATTCERCLRRWISESDPVSTHQGAFALRGEQLTLVAGAELTDEEVFDALILAGEHDLLLDPLIESHIETLVRQWPTGDDCPTHFAHRLREMLVDLDASSRTSTRLLELEILPRIVVEFEKIVCHVQHDLYHVYTTDIHSLKCLEAGRSLISNAPTDHRWPFFTHIASQIEDSSSFLLSCLFHDIGKNRGGEHSRRGAEFMGYVGPRLGLEEKAVDRLAFLVRHHLDLSTTSRRRDISDPAIIGELAELIGDLECLNQLTALTYCDVATVGPDVMNDWNASLLMELYQYLREVLEHGPRLTDEADPDQREKCRRRFISSLANEPALSTEHSEDFIAELSLDHLLDTEVGALLRQYENFCRSLTSPTGVAVSCYPLPERGVTEVIVIAPDQPGTLARISGAIASTGVNIMAADIVTMPRARTLDIFHIAHFNPGAVPPTRPKPVEGDTRLLRIQQRITDVLAGNLDIDEILSKRRDEQRLTPRPIPSVPTEVLLQPDASDTFVVIEVRAPDRLGLLYTIADTLLKCRVNTRVSRIDSLGNQAIDTFYIEEWNGDRLTKERTEEIIDTLLTTLQ